LELGSTWTRRRHHGISPFLINLQSICQTSSTPSSSKLTLRHSFRVGILLVIVALTGHPSFYPIILQPRCQSDFLHSSSKLTLKHSFRVGSLYVFVALKGHLLPPVGLHLILCSFLSSRTPELSSFSRIPELLPFCTGDIVIFTHTGVIAILHWRYRLFSHTGVIAIFAHRSYPHFHAYRSYRHFALEISPILAYRSYRHFCTPELSPISLIPEISPI
jgi:hypothetical protein